MEITLIFVCIIIFFIYLIKKFSDFRKCNGYNRILKKEYKNKNNE